jgi:hypothetical protein
MMSYKVLCFMRRQPAHHGSFRNGTHWANLVLAMPTARAKVFLHAMQVFDGSNNSFSGTLPDAWSSAVQLLHVNVSFNKLTGNLPIGWAVLGNLTTLDMSNNTLQVCVVMVWPLAHAVKLCHTSATAPILCMCVHVCASGVAILQICTG